MRPPQKAAKDRKLDGYVLPLQNTTQQPALRSLTSHDTRQKLFEASLNRAEHGDANDTRAIISEIAQLRARKAALFGAANWADYKLYDQMAKNRETAVAFLDRLAPAVSAGAAGSVRHPRARDVAGREVPADGGRLELLRRAIRKQRYALNKRRAEALFRVQQGADRRRVLRRQPALRPDLQERHDIPTWSPDMSVFQVYDQDGKPLGCS